MISIRTHWLVAIAQITVLRWFWYLHWFKAACQPFASHLALVCQRLADHGTVPGLCHHWANFDQITPLIQINEIFTLQIKIIEKNIHSTLPWNHAKIHH